MDEVWLPMPGFETTHEISNLGRARSTDRVTHDGKRLRGRVMRPFTMPSGHLRISPGRNGVKRTLKVHRLVLLAFIGPSPEGMEALRRDGNPANNRLENLHWGTKSENARDQIAHGTHPFASKTQCPQGHPYDEANTYVRAATGHRRCRQCTREQQHAAYWAKRRAA